jgi:glycosyltransferase involved in cell wall biosynthesis
MLLEQIKQLKNKGHKLYVYLRSKEGPVLPSWFNITVNQEILVPVNKSFVSYTDSCDILVAGWYEHLSELSQSKIPVFYWEQGHEWLFGDQIPTSNATQINKYLHKNYTISSIYLTAVSPFVAQVINKSFNRKVPVIPNGVDTNFYCPGNKNSDNTIILVGNPSLQFKGFNIALKALNILYKNNYKFKVVWVCQIKPHVLNISFPINFIVKPTQKSLAQHYREADIHLFTSWYEGFGMPPLEAMSSGVPVIATYCGGIETYAKPGYNTLLANPGDYKTIAEAIMILINNSNFSKVLAKRGRETALKFNIFKTVNILEEHLLKIVTSNSKDSDIYD